MRCPCCWGTGEAKWTEYWRSCPECGGAGVVHTIRQWFHARRHLGHYVAMVGILSCLAGAACAIVPSMKLSAFLSLVGINGNRNFDIGQARFDHLFV